MPEVIVKCPRNLFLDPTDLTRFVRELKLSVARHMDAIDPETNKPTQFALDPDEFIDLTIIEIDGERFSATTVCLVTIVTYGLYFGPGFGGDDRFFWPDRMRNIDERLKAICVDVEGFVPVGSRFPNKDTISVTFLGKGPDCWAYA